MKLKLRDFVSRGGGRCEDEHNSLKTCGSLSSSSDPSVHQIKDHAWVQSKTLFQNLTKTLGRHTTEDPKAKSLENI